MESHADAQVETAWETTAQTLNPEALNPKLFGDVEDLGWRAHFLVVRAGGHGKDKGRCHLEFRVWGLDKKVQGIARKRKLLCYWSLLGEYMGATVGIQFFHSPLTTCKSKDLAQASMAVLKVTWCCLQLAPGLRDWKTHENLGKEAELNRSH